MASELPPSFFQRMDESADELFYAQPRLVTHIDELNVIGDSAAELVLKVGMAGTDEDALLGFNADAYRFEMELERDGDEWLLIAARWGGLGDEVL